MNKTILVTGAAKRIGKEIALTFAAEDWNIIIHCHSLHCRRRKLAAEINTNRENQLQGCASLILIKMTMLPD